MEEECEPDEEDLTFWISHEDFSTWFSKLFIARTEEWEEQRFKNRFLKLTNSRYNDEDVVMAHAYYTLELKKSASGVVAVH